MKISVAICTYNGEKYIIDQIESIIEQSIMPDEIVLCDDGSQDKTIFVAENILKSSGINYIIKINQRNLGIVRNFEKAISLTTGDIVFLSDQDDVWKKQKIEIILEEFKKDSLCLMVFSDADLVDQKRQKKGVKLWETLEFSYEKFKKECFLNILLNRCVVTGATMAIRRELLDYCRPFQDPWIHDGWLAINASIYGRVRAIDEPLIEYRQHESNAIGAIKLNSFDRLKKYIKNIGILELEREKRAIRYEIFCNLNMDKLNSEKKNKTLECIKFWKDMCNLKKSSFHRGHMLVYVNLINGNYIRYYNGIRGAVRDLAYLYLRKVIK